MAGCRTDRFRGRGGPNKCQESIPPVHCAVSYKHQCPTGLEGLNGFFPDIGAPRPPPALESELPDWGKGACAQIRTREASSLRRVNPCF